MASYLHGLYHDYPYRGSSENWISPIPIKTGYCHHFQQFSVLQICCWNLQEEAAREVTNGDREEDPRDTGGVMVPSLVALWKMGRWGLICH